MSKGLNQRMECFCSEFIRCAADDIYNKGLKQGLLSKNQKRKERRLQYNDDAPMPQCSIVFIRW